MNAIFSQITSIVRLRLLSLNVKWSREVCKAAEIWNLPSLGRKGTKGIIDDMDIDDVT